MDYVDTSYNPDPKTEYVFEMKIVPKGMKLLETGELIARYTSFGDWTEANRNFPKESVKLKPKVCDVEDSSSTLWISYPMHIFEGNNIAQIISLYRKISSLGFLRNVKITDIHIPSNAIEKFYGSRYGSEIFRKRFAKPGPYTSISLDRSISLSPSSEAKIAYELWSNGIDVIREDVLHTDIPSSDFYKRIGRVASMQKRVEKETGKKKLFVPNITAETSEMVRRADSFKDVDGICVFVDAFSVGLSSLATLRKHCHIAFLSPMPFDGLNLEHETDGVSHQVATKLARISGIDSIMLGLPRYAGSVDGFDMTRYQSSDEVLHSILNILNSGRYGSKPLMPFFNGGVNLVHLPYLVSEYGKDLIVEFNESCYHHPDGLMAGARAISQAVEAVGAGVDLVEFSKGKKELQKALARWGSL